MKDKLSKVVKSMDFSVSFERIRFVRVRIILYVFAALIWGLFIYSLFHKPEPYEWITEAVVALAVTALLFFRVQLGSTLWALLKVIIFLVAPTLWIYLVEYVKLNPLSTFIEHAYLFNYISYLLIQVLLFVILGTCKRTVITAGALALFAGMANAYVERFRETPITPSDFYSFRVAMSVADQYDYSLSVPMACALIILIGLIMALLILPKDRWRWFKPLAALVILVPSLIYSYNFVMDGKLADFGIKHDNWKQERTYKKNGFLLSFIENLEDIKLRPGENYNAEAEKEELDAITATSGTVSEDKLPTVIVIMNESFWDIEAVIEDNGTGKIDLNVDTVLPFIHSWTEEDGVTKLEGLSSVFSAGTARSEFEFLTGSSTGFYPYDSMPYQQYIFSETPSLATWLKERYNYTNIAFHPYYGTGWDRERVYPLLGFDDFISMEDVENDPNFDIWRWTCTDMSDYKILLNILDEHENDSDPLFLFNVTMQNHGGYTKSYDDFTASIQETTTGKKALSNYLTLANASDSALEYLIGELEKRDEPIVLCFFGDHAPGISTTDLKKVLQIQGSSFSQSIRTVPVYFWSNYGLTMDASSIEKFSYNYMSTLFLDYIGLDKNQWFTYVEDMYNQMPIISRNYVQLENNRIRALNEDTLLLDPVNDYKNLAYYYLHSKSK